MWYKNKIHLLAAIRILNDYIIFFVIDANQLLYLICHNCTNQRIQAILIAVMITLYIIQLLHKYLLPEYRIFPLLRKAILFQLWTIYCSRKLSAPEITDRNPKITGLSTFLEPNMSYYCYLPRAKKCLNLSVHFRNTSLDLEHALVSTNSAVQTSGIRSSYISRFCCSVFSHQVEVWNLGEPIDRINERCQIPLGYLFYVERRQLSSRISGGLSRNRETCLGLGTLAVSYPT